ncbi:MAG: TspO/MBR family protein [Candidatus Howiella sp.]|jgi:benzodiazapine receptor
MRFAAKQDWKKRIVYLVVPLLVGALAAFISKDSFALYGALTRPPFSPPPWVFPIVWTFLYLLMGISSYLVSVRGGDASERALFLYGVQLFVQFFWPIIFFREQSYLLAFIWLCLLFVFVLIMTVQFYRIDRTAAFLQIPYLLWLVYAGYLNFGTFLLNRPM